MDPHPSGNAHAVEKPKQYFPKAVQPLKKEVEAYASFLMAELTGLSTKGWSTVGLLGGGYHSSSGGGYPLHPHHEKSVVVRMPFSQEPLQVCRVIVPSLHIIFRRSVTRHNPYSWEFLSLSSAFAGLSLEDSLLSLFAGMSLNSSRVEEKEEGEEEEDEDEDEDEEEEEEMEEEKEEKEERKRSRRREMNTYHFPV